MDRLQRGGGGAAGTKDPDQLDIKESESGELVRDRLPTDQKAQPKANGTKPKPTYATCFVSPEAAAAPSHPTSNVGHLAQSRQNGC